MFSVGDAVRFTGSFRDADRRAYDPRSIVVTVVHAGGAETLTMQSGVVRDATGEYHADVRLDFPGDVRVTFASTAPGEESHGQASYEVSVSRGDVAPAIDNYARSDRAVMVQELRDAGVRVDDSRSDAYVSAAHDQLVAARAQKVREKLRAASQARPWDPGNRR